MVLYLLKVYFFYCKGLGYWILGVLMILRVSVLSVLFFVGLGAVFKYLVLVNDKWM